MQNSMFKFYSDFQEFIAVTIGSLIQLLFAPTISYRLVITIIISSVAVALYIVKPLCHYLKIENVDVQAGFYAMSSIISVALIRLIIHSLPSMLKLKAISALGIDYNMLKEEEKGSKNDSN